MRSLLVLPLGLLVGCTFQVSAIGVSDGGSRDLPRPPDLNGSDRPMMMDLSVDAAPDLLPPGPDLDRFDLAGFLCPGGFAPWHVGELTEGDVSRWAPSDPSGNCQGSLNPVADTTLFTTGTESIRLQASCATVGLIYPRDTNAAWDLSGFTTMTLDIASDMPGFAMTSPTVFLVDNQMNYYTYSNASGKSLIPDKKAFAQLAIKLDGSDPSWPRSSTGIVSLSRINYVAVTWGNNKPTYTVWIDNLAFVPGPFVDCSPP